MATATHTDNCHVDVVVVGAGATGLTAARRLRARGLDVVVLEARDRIGGRLRTTELQGTRVELGGQWVSPDQTALLDLLAELEIETFPRYRDGQTVYIGRDGVRRTHDKDSSGMSEASDREMERMVAMLDALAAEVDPSAPWEHPDAEKLDAISFDEWLRQNCDDEEVRDNLAMTAGPAMLTKPATAFSALSALALAASIGGFTDLVDEDLVLDMRVAGGLAQVPQRLADEVGEAVILDSAVRRIEWTKDSAVVVSESGNYEASKVIVAVPPHLVTKIEFEPQLPPLSRLSRDEQTIGTVMKINVIYPTAFWREEGLSGSAFCPYLIVHEVYDNSNDDLSDGMGILVGFVSDVNLNPLLQLSPDDRRETVLEAISTYFGEAALQPLEYSESPWLDEQWTGGAYGTSFGMGGLTRFGPHINEEVGPLQFGTSDVPGPGYLHVDGAIRTGERLAASIP